MLIAYNDIDVKSFHNRVDQGPSTRSHRPLAGGGKFSCTSQHHFDRDTCKKFKSPFIKNTYIKYQIKLINKQISGGTGSLQTLPSKKINSIQFNKL